ncbi:hypothetical protein Zmor_009166 [Zophobas morio]|uniref:Uncharacterized protein n=1 Tax=Zophobas morio TaxID=2755281 RepID=A0AA38INN0_9CUCU|nr:hypothetical protein Zmor_009166 [Zophobas morio]
MTTFKTELFCDHGYPLRRGIEALQVHTSGPELMVALLEYVAGGYESRTARSTTLPSNKTWPISGRKSAEKPVRMKLLISPHPSHPNCHILTRAFSHAILCDITSFRFVFHRVRSVHLRCTRVPTSPSLHF